MFRSRNNRPIAASATASRSRRGDERDAGHLGGAATRRWRPSRRSPKGGWGLPGNSTANRAGPHPQLSGYFLNETLQAGKREPAPGEVIDRKQTISSRSWRRFWSPSDGCTLGSKGADSQ